MPRQPWWRWWFPVLLAAFGTLAVVAGIVALFITFDRIEVVVDGAEVSCGSVETPRDPAGTFADAACSRRVDSSNQARWNATFMAMIGVGGAGVVELLRRRTTRRLHAESDRVVLRTLVPGDATAIANSIDEVVEANNGWTEDVRERQRWRVALGAESSLIGVADPETDRIVGGLEQWWAADGTLEIGFWIAPEHRGKGLASEAVRLFVELVRGHGIEALSAETNRSNTSARWVLERNGFSPVGQHVRRLPNGMDVVVARYTLHLEPPVRSRVWQPPATAPAD